mmetsp:Transcript_10857/g.20104  ORF Transcript_10857/g.20104 Transcript_10857/m.20104 type:complete len:146 (-) Transcript_10857:825-1262(-)
MYHRLNKYKVAGGEKHRRFPGRNQEEGGEREAALKSRVSGTSRTAAVQTQTQTQMQTQTCTSQERKTKESVHLSFFVLCPLKLFAASTSFLKKKVVFLFCFAWLGFALLLLLLFYTRPVTDFFSLIRLMASASRAAILNWCTLFE